MAEVFLASGAQVTCSIEDYELVSGQPWRVWQQGRFYPPRVVRDTDAMGRRYRLHLHREIAFLMRPELVEAPTLVRVRPLNGNFLDVRRENLEILVRPRKRGGAKRPTGHHRSDFNRPFGKPVGTPPAWSREAARGGTVRGDGCGRAPDAPDPGERRD